MRMTAPGFRWVQTRRPPTVSLARRRPPRAVPPWPRTAPRRWLGPPVVPPRGPQSAGSRYRPGTGSSRRRCREPRPSACRPARTRPRSPGAVDPGRLARPVGVPCRSSHLPSTAPPLARCPRDAPEQRRRTAPARRTTQKRSPGRRATPKPGPRPQPVGAQRSWYGAVARSVPRRADDRRRRVRGSPGRLPTAGRQESGLLVATGVHPHSHLGVGPTPPCTSCWHK